MHFQTSGVAGNSLSQQINIEVMSLLAKIGVEPFVAAAMTRRESKNFNVS